MEIDRTKVSRWMDEIELEVSEHHPHLLGVSEANLKSVHDIQDVQLQEYDLILSKTMDNDQLQVSRVVCYKHQSLVGKVREDLMMISFPQFGWKLVSQAREKSWSVNFTENGDFLVSQTGVSILLHHKNR